MEQHLTITHIGLKCYLFCILLRTFNCPVKVERIDFMAVALKEDYQRALDEQKKEVRELVMVGLEQIKEGKTKDFNTVCDRLEKKYRDEAISN